MTNKERELCNSLKAHFQKLKPEAGLHCPQNRSQASMLFRHQLFRDIPEVCAQVPGAQGKYLLLISLATHFNWDLMEYDER